MFCSEGNTPSIYLNESMLARIIRDPAWWVQDFLNESLQIAFPNNVLISKFHN